jgi:DNA polymerase-3 subunit epsilon
VFGIGKLLFRGASSSLNLAADVGQALQAWQALPATALDEVHFHVRYVVVDVTTSGTRPNEDQLLGISAVGIQRGGAICPEDAVLFDFSATENDSAAVDRQLMAFLQFLGKSPLISYHSPFVLAFLQRAFKERLGIDFAPPSLDLAWLLPSMFDEFSDQPAPLDQWVVWFGMTSDGRRAAMANTLMLARLFQRVLVRAVEKKIVTAERLMQESSASNFLRRSR